MKKIRISRQRKVQKPPEPKPAPAPEDAASEYSSSESIPETEPPTEQFANLNTHPEPVPRKQVHFEATQPTVRRHELYGQQTRPARQRMPAPLAPPRRMLSARDPRPIQYEKPLEQVFGRPKLKFRSHYGANGDYLDTQTRSRILYNSCFG